MGTPSSSTRDLAQRLLAVEAASPSTADARVPEAVRVCEKLRVALTRFAGADGFTSLLRRALALAGAEAPALETVKLQPDGFLEGLEALVAEGPHSPDAAVALIAQLLELLTTFIGEPLTWKLLREAWPEAAWD